MHAVILIVASSKDVASLNIKKQILNHYSFNEIEESFQGKPIYATEVNGKDVKLVTLRDESMYAKNITQLFSNAELIVFISRHSSASGTPTLSTHTPGNLGEARLGGISRKVSVSPANAMRSVLKSMMHLKEEMQLDYDVSYECTHHGPSLNAPAMFVELGSSAKQWSDLKAAEAVAHATVEAVSSFDVFPARAVLGIGGPHYNRKFTKIALQNDLAFGHIIPKYAVSKIDVEVLKQCVEKTLEKVEFTVLDWKGIKGEHKPKLIAMLEEMEMPLKKAKH
jgi:D-aminoacyl-tRNA deacylase